jgi:hypothetical protein
MDFVAVDDEKEGENCPSPNMLCRQKPLANYTFMVNASLFLLSFHDFDCYEIDKTSLFRSLRSVEIRA